MKEILLTEKGMVFLVLLYFHASMELSEFNNHCLSNPLDNFQAKTKR